MELQEILKWLGWPFALCVVLVGIHGYLGIHVLARKVIFVDLAMAQIAALGATVAFALGYDPSVPGDSAAVFGFSLAFALAGAAVFSFTRMRHEKVPQEAFIGIVYASATAIAILVLAKLPHGGEHLEKMFRGNILFVQWPMVIQTAAIYAAVGAFHWVFRRKFFLISFEPERAAEQGLNVRLWDFLFYASFGVVITSSVAIAGVLLVFTFLVVPACVAVLFAESARSRLVIAWSLGVVVTLAGMIASYYGSFPTGPAVVAAFAGLLAVAGVVHAIRVSARPGRSAARAAAFAAGLVLLGWGTAQLRKPDEEHVHGDDVFAREAEALRSGDETQVIAAIHRIEDLGDDHAGEEFQKLLESKPSDRVIAHLAHAIAKVRHAPAVPALVEAGGRTEDASLKVEIARAVLELRDARGFRLLLEVLESDPEPLWRGEAEKTLAAVGAPVQDAAARNAWWESKGRKLKWRESTMRFE